MNHETVDLYTMSFTRINTGFGITFASSAQRTDQTLSGAGASTLKSANIAQTGQAIEDILVSALIQTTTYTLAEFPSIITDRWQTLQPM